MNSVNAAQSEPVRTEGLPHFTMARIRGVVVQNGARGVTPSFIAPLDTDAGELVPLAFVKDLTAKELMGEILGACIGHSLGLPIPQSFLTIAESDQGPWQHGPVIGDNGERLLFASSAVESPTTLFFEYSTLGPQVIQRLVAWPHFAGAVAFDEWIANVDRHCGNLLLSGADFWLIDHSHVLTGNSWLPSTLVAQAGSCLRNQITEYTTPTMSSPERDVQRRAAQAACAAHSGIEVAALLASFPLHELLPPLEREAVLTFLTERKSHTDNLLGGRFK